MSKINTHPEGFRKMMSVMMRFAYYVEYHEMQARQRGTLTVSMGHYDPTTLHPDAFPPLLREIADPPKKLYLRGTLPTPEKKLLTIVGSRKYTSYGKQAVQSIVSALSGYPISIVSGLAIGIDGIAHAAALDAGLHTIAVPGSGLSDSVLYPSANRALAARILKSGGALLSEFEPDFKTTPWCFPARNRIVAGLSHATLIVEAQERSGTLITARLAADYNRDVLAVPGSIFSKNSVGPNQFIRLGATPVTSGADVLEALGFSAERTPDIPQDIDGQGRRVLEFLIEPRSREEIVIHLSLPAHEVSVLLSLLELRGYVREQSGMFIRLV